MAEMTLERACVVLTHRKHRDAAWVPYRGYALAWKGEARFGELTADEAVVLAQRLEQAHESCQCGWKADGTHRDLDAIRAIPPDLRTLREALILFLSERNSGHVVIMDEDGRTIRAEVNNLARTLGAESLF